MRYFSGRCLGQQTRTSEVLIEKSVVRATILFQLIGSQALGQVRLAQCTKQAVVARSVLSRARIAARRVTRPAPPGVGPFFDWRWVVMGQPSWGNEKWTADC